MTKLGQDFSIYGLISFSGKVIKGKHVSLVLPQNKLKFNVERDIYKKDLILEVEKLHEKNPVVTSKDNILNFSIFCTKRNKFIGQKRKMKLSRASIYLGYKIVIVTDNLTLLRYLLNHSHKK